MKFMLESRLSVAFAHCLLNIVLIIQHRLEMSRKWAIFFGYAGMVLLFVPFSVYVDDQGKNSEVSVVLLLGWPSLLSFSLFLAAFPY